MSVSGIGTRNSKVLARDVAEFLPSVYSGHRMENFTGVVIRGINNIYAIVRIEDIGNLSKAQVYACRIKGKVLQGVDDAYNPLAVGDRVDVGHHGQCEGMIIGRKPRMNSFERWNIKRGCNQTVVANMDLLVCVCSTDDPPFRPRFVDRVLVCSRGIPVLIVLNKCDLEFTLQEDERFRLYQELGYGIFAMSAFDPDGIDALQIKLQGKMVAFVGQSGVGKSTIVNALAWEGSKAQKIGGISDKFHRGRHTTNHAIMMSGRACILVDTPGVRELLVPHDDPMALAEAFPEFRTFAGTCAFHPCLHDHEPGCMVKQAVIDGCIHPDRYERYLRMLSSLEDRPEEWENDRR